MSDELRARIAAVRARVAAAAARAGRDPSAITVIAVSKRHAAARVAAARAEGLADFGENYAQELVAKADAVADPGIRWHFIGRLQRNKARTVVGRAALIHAVDSEALAAEIDRRAAAAGIVQPVLVAVNVAGEASKTGVDPDDTATLVAACRALPAVRCDGLMTMPPIGDPDASRPWFRALAALRDAVAARHGPLPELSMGTTADFEVAVEQGATLIRIGAAIFGARPR